MTNETPLRRGFRSNGSSGGCCASERVKYEDSVVVNRFRTHC